MSETESTGQAIDQEDAGSDPTSQQTKSQRLYKAPRMTKKRAMSRVTLFSGGGVSAGGLTTSG